MRKKTASEIICQNFKISPQQIFQDYKCNYQSSILYFGRLYIGEEHFLFIANMFGLVKKCCIKIQNINKIDQSEGFSVITIVQLVQGKLIQYKFGSFSNNSAYQLMLALWKGQKIGSDVIKNDNQAVNEQYNKLLEQDEKKICIDEGQVQANFFNPQVIQKQKQKIVQIQLPCSVQQFYLFFIADGATVYPRKKHLQNKGATNINVTQWRKNQQFNSQVREINAKIKVTGIPFLKEAGMSQVWKLKREEQSLLLNIVTQMADVPYSSYFNCEQHIVISKQGDKKCRMITYLSIIFNRQTYMKGTILGRTQGDMLQQYEQWTKNVNAILDQIRKKKDLNEQQEKQDKKKVQVQYESSFDSQKMLISSPFSNSVKKTEQHVNIPININQKKIITMEQKVNLILVFVIFLVSAEVLKIIF